jgi:uncharacterized protein DUF302
MNGPSGLLLFGTTDHGWLVSLLGETKEQAIQYVVGNPLIAIEMTQHNLAAGLCVPLRVLIYEADGKTRLEYDRPSPGHPVSCACPGLMRPVSGVCVTTGKLNRPLVNSGAYDPRGDRYQCSNSCRQACGDQRLRELL